MHKLIYSVSVAAVLLCSCSNKIKQPAEEVPAVPEDKSVSLLTDRAFTNGLDLKGGNSAQLVKGNYIYPFGGNGQQPNWQLAEWGSKYLLKQSNMKDQNGTKVYTNDGKLVSFRREGNDMHITFDVITSKEYDQPRVQNQAWPHLLLEQSFATKPRLKDLDSLFLQFEGRLANCTSKMGTAFDPGLHTAQFQIFITLQDLNQQSPNYGELVWFGVPFYDYRYRQQEVYAAQDVGKGDATGMFIYSLGTTDYMTGSFHDGNWIKINKDLKPFMEKALAIAKERGYLKNSSLDDIHISGMNIGWEVPGTFDASFEFKGFDIRYTPKQ